MALSALKQSCRADRVDHLDGQGNSDGGSAVSHTRPEGVHVASLHRQDSNLTACCSRPMRHS